MSSVLSPSELEEMDEEEIEAYNRKRELARAELIQEETREIGEDTEAAIDALRDPEEDDTAKVESGQTTLTVKTYLDAQHERDLNRLTKRRNDEQVQRTILPRMMAWLVEGPEEYTKESTWEAYGEKYGFDELALVWFKTLLPKVERMESSEAVRRFRDITEGSVDTRDGE